MGWKEGLIGGFCVYLVGLGILWQILPPQPRCSVGEKNEVFVAFSPDSASLLTQDHPGQFIRLWATQTGKKLQDWKNPMRFIHRAIISPNTEFVLMWGWQGECQIMNLHTGKIVMRTRTYGPFESRTRFLFNLTPFRFTADSRFAAVVSASDDLEMWEVATGILRYRLPGVSRFTILPDGKTLAVAELAPRLFPTPWTWSFLQELAACTCPLLPLPPEFQSRIEMLEHIKLVDLATGNPKSNSLGTLVNVTALLASHDGKQLVASYVDTPPSVPSDRSIVRRWNLATMEELPAIDVFDPQAEIQWAAAVRFCPENRILWLNQNRGFSLWDVSQRQPLRFLPYVDDAVASPDARWLIVRRSDPQRLGLQAVLEMKRARMIDMQSREATPMLQWEDKIESARGVGFTPDNRYALVRISHEPDQAPTDFWHSLTSLFESDGAAEIGEAGPELRIYEVATHKLVSTIPRPIFAVRVSPDGKTMVFSNQRAQDALGLWDLPPGTPWRLILLWPAYPALVIVLLGLFQEWRKRRAARRARLVWQKLEMAEL